MKTKNDIRMLNQYRVLFVPDHPKAMTCDNWNGYVYEHILIAEEFLERPLIDNEVVHHLDGNRGNNRIENLLVLNRGQHSKLHAWLQSGAPGIERSGENGVNSGKSKVAFCKCCQRTLQRKQKEFCSPECSNIGRRKAERPTKKQLERDIKSMSWLALGRKYGVSDNAVRKWARQYGLL